MEDTRSASLILIAGAVGVGYWYWHLKHGRLSVPAAAPTDTGPAGLPKVSVPAGSRLADLESFADAWGLHITSSYRPGSGSLHALGWAIDTAIPAPSLQAQVEAAAAAAGIHIYPETAGQVGANGSVSTGAHWHLSYPKMENGRLVF